VIPLKTAAVTFLTASHRSSAFQHASPSRLRSAASVQTPWGWALGGVLLGLLLSLLVFAPARWLASAVRQASHSQVLLEDARGTLWSGSAQLSLTGGAGSDAVARLPSRLFWALQPGVGGMTLQLQTSCCLTQPWHLLLLPRWAGAQLQVSDTPSTWPAQLLSGLGTPFNTLAPEGQLALSTQGLTLTWAAGRLQLAGQAQLDAQDLASRLSTLRPMGSYRLTLTGGAVPELSLVTLQGPLQLSGRGTWVGGKLRFAGEASSSPQHQAALSNLLNIIGRRNGARSIIQFG